jgi:Heterokaryon incompatibility protein (HET)
VVSPFSVRFQTCLLSLFSMFIRSFTTAAVRTRKHSHRVAIKLKHGTGNNPSRGFGGLHNYHSMHYMSSSPQKSDRESYRYDALIYSDSIRLLKLLRGARNSQLQCEILEQRKGSGPAFEALSYTWGAPVFAQVLEEVKSNTIIRLTENLSDALHEFRLEDMDRYLWIDQICIDQQNALEKSNQVAAMDEIYRGATRTLVWLGKEEAHEAMDELERIGADFESYGYKSVFPFPPTVWNQEYLQKFIALFETCNGGALYDFFGRPWFERVWVFQEFILARDLEIHCGSRSISYDLFSKALCIFYVITRKINVGYMGIQHDLGGVMKLISSPRYTRAWELIRRRERYIALQSIALEKEKEELVKEAPGTEKRQGGGMSLQESYYSQSASLENIQPSSLIDLCIATRELKCSVIQDKVYGILGISLRNHLLVPDYTITPKALWAELAVRCLESGDLTVLHYAGVDLHHVQADVPTYAINFSHPVPTQFRFGGESTARYHAGSTAQPRVRLVRMLAREGKPSIGPQIDGYVVDHVAKVVIGSPGTGGAEDLYWTPKSLRGLYRIVADWRNSFPDPYNGESLHTVFTRTILADNAHPHVNVAAGGVKRNDPSLVLMGLIALNSVMLEQRIIAFHERVAQAYGTVSLGLRNFDDEEPVFYNFPSEDPKAWEVAAPDGSGFASAVELDGPIIQQLQVYLQTVSMVLNRRCVFMTSKGYLGIGPGSMVKGSIVFVPIGAQTPFVLHTLSSAVEIAPDDVERRAMHMLMGECYLHGWMDGEALEESNGCRYAEIVLR